jgi:type I restriction enzyme R subunit
MRFTEETLELAVLELFQLQQIPHYKGAELHKEMREVLLVEDIKGFLLTQYEDITLNEVQSVIRKLQAFPSAALYESNKAIIQLIADGFILKREDANKKDLFIQLIDYETIDNNIFRVVNQLEIQGYEKRIPDAIVYINGLPLVVFEFKSAVKEKTTLLDAYNQLTIRYRRDIPELFKYNAFCVISDGVNNKCGSIFALYKFFYAWRKTDIHSKPVDGINSLFTMIKGVFEKERLLDIIRNFVYFPDSSKNETKIVCRYPQYYAATKLIKNIKLNMRPNGKGKGGTYFGTTGCGKSFTMLFLVRLLMRNVHFASPTIIIIADRTDLEEQLSGEFLQAKGFIGDDYVVSVESREDLRKQLQGRKSGGVFITTIQKFTENTELLTERNNVICISDEAHRSQINLDEKLVITEKGVERKFGFAKYLHDSLPNATYVGFTGTPIDATIEVFGNIIDAYTMQESVEDDITVRLVYEGRAAKVLLNETKLQEIEYYYEKCTQEGASEYQVEESKKAVTQMEVILGNPDRLKVVAADFVQHYETRLSEGASVKGKVMFVASSRTIAYNLYKEILALRPSWGELRQCEEGVILSETEQKEVKPIEKVRLIMTRGKDDVKELYDAVGSKDDKKELDRQFKNAKSNFKIAIVVDMWLTGFDVPFLDAIYIDKPIEKHSLIQTISRVNRVYEGKEIGLVVDYIGIKTKMDLALRAYSGIADNTFQDAEKAVIIVKDQLSLLAMLFHTFNATDFFEGTPLQQLHCLNRAAEYVQQTEDKEKRFMGMVKRLRSAYQLCCSSESLLQKERNYIHFFFAVAAIIHKLTKGEAPDTAQMNERVRQMIEEAIKSEGVEDVFKLTQTENNEALDLFGEEYLARINKLQLPNTKIKLLQRLLAQAIEEYKRINRIKGVDFSKRLKALIEVYNERSDELVFADDVLEDVAQQFADLFKDLQKERNSFMDLGINFEEKAFFDILKAIAEKYNFEYPESKLIPLSQKVKAVVDDKAKYTDWAQREDIKAELKVDLILVLAENGYPPFTKDEVFKEIFEQAENFKKYR